MSNTFTRPYFFDAGIRFACRRCGTCCTGSPGIVHITPEEIEKIAIHLNQSVQDVTTEFIHPYPKGLAIAESPDGGCRVYSKNGCVIYPVRPIQCRTYPSGFRPFGQNPHGKIPVLSVRASEMENGIPKRRFWGYYPCR